MGRKKSGKSDKVMKLYESGSSIEEIAKELGYKKSSVKTILGKAGLQRRKFAKNYHETIVRMSDEGKSVREIAEVIGMSYVTTSNYMQETGIRRKNYRVSPTEEERIVNMQFAVRKPVVRKVIYSGRVWVDVTEVIAGG